MATNAFGLGRRRYSWSQPCYLHPDPVYRLCTVTAQRSTQHSTIKLLQQTRQHALIFPPV